jgi:SAM-dependent methyltransferase
MRETMIATPDQRRKNYREMIRSVFGATADLYYSRWGEFFHLAVFEQGDDPADFEAVLERTHVRYFEAIGGARTGRILELACGGGAFAEWMAARTPGEVIGLDLSDAQLAHARKRLQERPRPNLRFVEHDIMHLSELDEPLFDAAICLDAACYLPDKQAALAGMAARLRPGARLLLVDWCRPARITALQNELLLEPLYRYWGMPEMATVAAYRRGFRDAGLRLLEVTDLSGRVAANWERGYRQALQALGESITISELAAVAVNAVKYGPASLRLAKDQFYAVLFAKAAADAGLLRYVYYLAERT